MDTAFIDMLKFISIAIFVYSKAYIREKSNLLAPETQVK